MSKKVIVSVQGFQGESDGEQHPIEFITQGRFYSKGDNYYVTYKESEVTGMEGTTTTLKIAEDKVTLMRFGTVNAQFVFEEGQKHIAHYDTQHGSFTIGVFAQEVDIRVGDSGGELSVRYGLQINDGNADEIRFSMQIREV